MKALRYIEVTTTADAKEVFLEAGRTLVRSFSNDLNVARLLDFNTRLQKLEKKPEISFRKRYLTALPNTFLQYTSVLQKIKLDSNAFRYFPLEILLCTQLRELNLNNNEIEDIPNGIQKLNLLNRFEIENNKIESLPIRAVSSFHSSSS